MTYDKLFNFLTPEEKKIIAERVYEEELRKQFQADFEKRNPMIFHDQSILYCRILDKYISDMNLKHDDFIEPFKMTLQTELQNFISEKYADVDSGLYGHFRWKLQQLAEEVIIENTEELKPIIREKVFKCCNETLLIAFLSDIVRKMDLDSAVKKIIAETQGNKV